MPGALNYLKQSTNGDPWLMFKLEGMVGYLVGFRSSVNEILFLCGFSKARRLVKKSGVGTVFV